jgi:hypothetical protein
VPSEVPRWTQSAIDQAIALAPTFLLVLGVVVGGVALAYGLRRAVTWAVRRFGVEALAERLGVSRLLYTLGVQQGLARVCGQASFWAVLLVTVHSASELMGLKAVSQGIGALLGYAPSALTALAILIAGFLAADVAGRIVRGVSEKSDALGSPMILSKAVYWVVVVLAGTMSAEQLGLAVDLINTLIEILAAGAALGLALAFSLGAREAAGAALGLALAFSLGAREAASNWIARHYVAQLYRPGDHVQMGDQSGVVLNFSPTAVILDDGGVDVVIPCKHFLEHAVRLQRARVGSEAASPDPTDAPDPKDGPSS